MMKIEIKRNNDNLDSITMYADIIIINRMHNKGDLYPFVDVRLITGKSIYNFSYDNTKDTIIKFIKE